MDNSSRGTWTAFLAITFLIVGLTGLFATFSAPLPLERALARDAALDDALAALKQPEPAAAIEALRPRLAESADAILPFGGDMATRIGAERAAMRSRLQVEADVTAERLRWMICVITLMCAFFGAAILSFSRRAPAPENPTT
jgi:hypothetical protein